MKLSVLSENTAYSIFNAEHGFSLFVEHDIPLLFDTGASRLFMENARKMHLDIDRATKVVLSHGHWDHGNGLRYLSNKELICHPDVFMKRYSSNGSRYIGLNLEESQLAASFQIEKHKTPYWISEKILFLGEIPRKTDFESVQTTFTKENGEPDFVPDDTGIALVSANELIVISGCAHAGICNTIEHAIEVTGIKKVKAVMGGFHLHANDEITKKTIDYLKRWKEAIFMPCHCTGFEAKMAFSGKLKTKPVHAGQEITFE